MLCLNLNVGEYLTIGEDVVVQLDRITGDRCKLVVEAPRGAMRYTIDKIER